MHCISGGNHCKTWHILLLVMTVISSLDTTQISTPSTLVEKCDNADVQLLCLDQETCEACMNINACCYWCYDEKYEGRKCNVLNQLSSCSKDKIERNFETTVTTSVNRSLTETVEITDMENIIQMQPQKFDVILRKDGKPVTIDFVYKPVSNYPMELYFLGDLGETMYKKMQYLKDLGLKLTHTLKSLTTNFKIAFGSFNEKLDMPFSFTEADNFENPCLWMEYEKCEKGYLFNHRLDFTSDTEIFSKEVNKSQITANTDDLDGALDAILQILVCGTRIGWSEKSRKIILLSTDSLLHVAGDGILVGAVLRPTDECLLDDNGYHSQPIKYDYPSMEQIVTLLKQKKVNIIFAVTKPKLDYYLDMSKSLVKNYGFVGLLEDNAENILELIKQGYQNFAEQVSFFINTTYHEHLDVKFYADCDNNGTYNETSTCYGVKTDAIKFRAEISLNDRQFDFEDETVYIEDKNIDEKIEISIRYAGKCGCGEDLKRISKCGHGERRCGVCNCEPNWTGVNCTENCENTDVRLCQERENGSISRICHSHGDCECGKCKCNSPYVGKYCEHECPVENKLICGGIKHGTCVSGKCNCEPEYDGPTCSCSTSKVDCDFGGTICSGFGECECNKCKCNEGYQGGHCETNQENNTICEKYTKYIEAYHTNGTKRMENGDYHVQIVETNSLEIFQGPICNHVMYVGGKRCTYQFSYYMTDKTINLPTKSTCSMTAGFGGTVGGTVIIGLVLIAGLLGIGIYKFKIHREDKLEYERFRNTQSNFNEMNPLYVNPIKEYENPLRKRNNN